MIFENPRLKILFFLKLIVGNLWLYELYQELFTSWCNTTSWQNFFHSAQHLCVNIVTRLPFSPGSTCFNMISLHMQHGTHGIQVMINAYPRPLTPLFIPQFYGWVWGLQRCPRGTHEIFSKNSSVSEVIFSCLSAFGKNKVIFVFLFSI